jgi:anti-anti-sigma factor
MQARLFEARVRQRPEVAVADLHGDIQRESESALTAAYEAAAREGATTVLLNFADVGYINSTGIAVIVGLLARARKDGRTLIVCGLSDHYRTIFEITRLIDFMQVYPDEETAITTAAAS